MGKLSDDFFMPPFSVLNARSGEWQKRKREWISRGIKSELGRGDCITWAGDAITEPGLNHYRNKNGLLGIREQARSHYNAAPGHTLRPACDYSNKERGDGAGKPMKGLARSTGQDLMKGENGNFDKKKTVSGCLGSSFPTIHAYDDSPEGGTVSQSGTSIFDPVLCELVYRWFCPTGGHVLDPFAGGSVRGIVAALLGYNYTGIDLSERQIEANRQQWNEISGVGGGPHKPDGAKLTWITGDSRQCADLAKGKYDLIFSCPPYADLEIYSDDPRDISVLEYAEFLKAYNEIIAASLSMLKPNRFACFVVGDIRDKKGFYRNFVSDTIAAFQDNGANLYNEAILITAAGSLPIRVKKQFSGYRKLGKTHQNILIFYKGDISKIKTEFGEVDLGKTHEQVSFGFFQQQRPEEDARP